MAFILKYAWTAKKYVNANMKLLQFRGFWQALAHFITLLYKISFYWRRSLSYIPPKCC
jgi:hypothetical protein